MLVWETFRDLALMFGGNRKGKGWGEREGGAGEGEGIDKTKQQGPP